MAVMWCSPFTPRITEFYLNDGPITRVSIASSGRLHRRPIAPPRGRRGHRAHLGECVAWDLRTSGTAAGVPDQRHRNGLLLRPGYERGGRGDRSGWRAPHVAARGAA